ncbi:hypothetical protein [Rhodanobacter lindaniclasticus]
MQQRPLNGREFRDLVAAIDGAWQAPSGARTWPATIGGALRVATSLAGMLDEHVAPPFRVEALNDAFSERLLAHLRQSIDAFRQADAVCAVLLAGPKAWFAAKAARACASTPGCAGAVDQGADRHGPARRSAANDPPACGESRSAEPAPPVYASVASLYASTGMQAHMMFLSP